MLLSFVEDCIEFFGGPPIHTWIPAVALKAAKLAGACLETGNSVLQDFGFTLPAYAMILAMLAFLVALHTVSFLALSGLHKSGK